MTIILCNAVKTHFALFYSLLIMAMCVVLFRYDNGHWLHERHAPGWTNPTTEAGQPMPDLRWPSKPSSRTPIQSKNVYFRCLKWFLNFLLDLINILVGKMFWEKNQNCKKRWKNTSERKIRRRSSNKRTLAAHHSNEWLKSGPKKLKRYFCYFIILFYSQ